MLNLNTITFLFFISCFLGIYPPATAQILSDSEHPVIHLNTANLEIPDEPKIEATMGIIDNGPGQLNNINDPLNHFDGNIGIETRGNSTQEFDKKTYSIELRTSTNQDTSVALLGMGKEEDWILHAMVIDKTQLRIPMSFYFFQQMGHYAAHWRYVELVLNGEYRGLYIMTEKIKRDKHRVDIAKLDEDDLAGDSLSGGYILRIDWLDDPEGFSSNYNSQGGEPMFYQWYYPKVDKIKTQQANYIESFIGDFEDAVFSPSFSNPSGTRYTDLIDVQSFADFVLINELSKNSDGYKLSSYLHKDRNSRGGKLKAGPIWDFDQTYGMSTVCSNNDFTGWTYLQNQPECEDLETMPMWWQGMMTDTVFTNYLACRWDSLRAGILQEAAILEWIDTQTTFISPAIDRNFTLWDEFLGEHIWAEPDPLLETYEEEIAYLKTWISNRLDWLDANMPGNCDNNILSALENVAVPHFSVYPNPVKTVLYITGESGDLIQLMTTHGQILYTHQLAQSTTQIDLGPLPQGIYCITVRRGAGFATKRVVVLE